LQWRKTAHLFAKSAGPGTKYASKGYIEPGVYRIVKEDGIWLKLYSGAGWISSKYAKKLNE
jgi:uncharacterized protein YraI